MSQYRVFALQASDGTWGFRVNYVQGGQDTLCVRNMLQLSSKKQAIACAQAHLLLLTNGDPGKTLDNPVEGLKLRDIDVQLFVASFEEGHSVTLSAFTKAGERITTFSSSTIPESADAVERLIEVLPRGLELIARTLSEFGMHVPPDWAASILVRGTDAAFVQRVRKAVGDASQYHE